MKILHVLSDTNIGGAGILLLNCLRHFDRSEFDIKVVLPRDAELVDRVKDLGYDVIEMKYGHDASYEKAATRELKKIFFSERPDIVHTHSSLSARIAAKKCRVPLIFQTHHCAVVPPKYKTVFPFKNAFGAINNYLSDKIIATAEAAEDILVMQGTKRSKIITIANGSEPLRRTSDTEKSALRKSLGLTDSNFVFSMIARLEPVKDHRTFIFAAAEAARTHENLRFLIVGKGSLEDSLRSLAADCGISDKVIFAGFSSDVAPYMNITDVNVNCSFSETSCLALSEGMSLGLPSIASDCAGNLAMINNGENGLIFETKNSEMLATAMITLAENPTLLEKMRQASKETFEQKYTAAVMTKQIEKLYINEYAKKCKLKGKTANAKPL
ncbi:MAG: glycosyltransferase [Clostridia bacterium]|nr:glycosyltransferase [Clostridia bacterium]